MEIEKERNGEIYSNVLLFLTSLHLKMEIFQESHNEIKKQKYKIIIMGKYVKSFTNSWGNGNIFSS